MKMIEIDVQYEISTATRIDVIVTTMCFQVLPRVGESVYFDGKYWEVVEVQHEPTRHNTGKPYTKVIVK